MQVEMINVKPATERVLAFIRTRMPAGAKETTIARPWKEVASEIGLTHEAVYRALAQLQRDGQIARDGAKITLG